MREAWTIRRNGRALVGVVVTVEPSLLEGLPREWSDGQWWYVVGRRK